MRHRFVFARRTLEALMPRYQFQKMPKGSRVPGSGRAKGKPNRIGVEVRVLAEQIVSDANYQHKLRKDVRNRKVHPTIEAMLWAYTLGRPRQQIDVTGVLDVEVTARQVEEREALAALDLAELEALAAESQALIDRAIGRTALSPPEIREPERKVSELLEIPSGSDNARSVNFQTGGNKEETTPENPTAYPSQPDHPKDTDGNT